MAVELAGRLMSAVEAFLDRLEPRQRESAVLSFDSHERREWAYWPTPRPGIQLGQLDRAGAKAAHEVLAALLPVPSFARAVTIMGLEEVLSRSEGFADDRRHHRDYWVTVFGSPRSSPWGVRFEGHHVSVHATVLDEEVRLTPLFLGANPAVVRDGDHVAAAPLAPEEQLGFELLHSLTGEQRADAVVSDTAPPDILSRNLPRLTEGHPDGGLPLSAMSGGSARAAAALLDVYLGRFVGGALRPEPDGARFCWAGAAEPGIGHYYRVAGPGIWIELDNTQNGANHVHTVVRDPRSDFGDDLLADHHRAGH